MQQHLRAEVLARAVVAPSDPVCRLLLKRTSTGTLSGEPSGCVPRAGLPPKQLTHVLHALDHRAGGVQRVLVVGAAVGVQRVEHNGVPSPWLHGHIALLCVGRMHR